MCDCLNRRYVWNYSHPTVGLPSSNGLDCYNQAICYSGYLSLEKEIHFSFFFIDRRKGNGFSSWKCCYTSCDCIRSIGSSSHTNEQYFKSWFYKVVLFLGVEPRRLFLSRSVLCNRSLIWSTVAFYLNYNVDGIKGASQPL